ncbi:hypothetical protein [Sneathiella sp.]|uniref:hypothetical protein n=1 Tax=Sneathiella sp. TaxID=1964365 RepID=UPI002FE13C96
MKLVMAAKKSCRPDAGRDAWTPSGPGGLAAFEGTGTRHWKGHTETHRSADHAFTFSSEFKTEIFVPDMQIKARIRAAEINADALQENIDA